MSTDRCYRNVRDDVWGFNDDRWWKFLLAQKTTGETKSSIHLVDLVKLWTGSKRGIWSHTNVDRWVVGLTWWSRWGRNRNVGIEEDMCDLTTGWVRMGQWFWYLQQRRTEKDVAITHSTGCRRILNASEGELVQGQELSLSRCKTIRRTFGGVLGPEFCMLEI